MLSESPPWGALLRRSSGKFSSVGTYFRGSFPGGSPQGVLSLPVSMVPTISLLDLFLLPNRKDQIASCVLSQKMQSHTITMLLSPGPGNLWRPLVSSRNFSKYKGQGRDCLRALLLVSQTTLCLWLVLECDIPSGLVGRLGTDSLLPAALGRGSTWLGALPDGTSAQGLAPELAGAFKNTHSKPHVCYVLSALGPW